MSDSKKRLFEIMGRLDPTFKPVLREEKQTKKYKKQINEYDNYNYPAGADADPNAPWNQADEPEWNGEFDVEPSDNIEDFMITMFSTSPQATHRLNLYTLVQKYAQGEDDYFLNAISMPNPEKNPELMKIIERLLGDYAMAGNVEWEYDEPYYPNED